MNDDLSNKLDYSSPNSRRSGSKNSTRKKQSNKKAGQVIGATGLEMSGQFNSQISGISSSILPPISPGGNAGNARNSFMNQPDSEPPINSGERQTYTGENPTMEISTRQGGRNATRDAHETYQSQVISPTSMAAPVFSKHRFR